MIVEDQFKDSPQEFPSSGKAAMECLSEKASGRQLGGRHHGRGKKQTHIAEEEGNPSKMTTNITSLVFLAH